MKSSLFRIEILVAAMLPVTALWVIGILSMRNLDSVLFLVVLALSSVLVFLAELAIFWFFQRTTRSQQQALTEVCRAYVAGDLSQRATPQGDETLLELTHTINTLLEHISSQMQTAARNQFAANEFQRTTQAVQKLIGEIKPVMEGDLRVHASATSGDIGLISDICNALIEELVDLAKWTRYSTGRVKTKTHTLLSNAVELARTTETQMLRFSETTEAVEKLVAFVQRLSNTLQLNVEIVHEALTALKQHTGLRAVSADATVLRNEGSDLHLVAMLQRLQTDLQRQEQLLKSLLDSTQSHATLAESMISDLYAIARRSHDASTAILTTAQYIHSLSVLAQQWHNSVATFQLPEDALQESTQEEEEDSMTPEGPLRKQVSLLS